LAGGGTAGLEPIRITHPIPTGCKAQCLRCRGKIVLDVVQGYTCGDFAPRAGGLTEPRHPLACRRQPAGQGGKRLAPSAVTRTQAEGSGRGLAARAANGRCNSARNPAVQRRTTSRGIIYSSRGAQTLYQGGREVEKQSRRPEPDRITAFIPTDCKARCLRCRPKMSSPWCRGHDSGHFRPAALSSGFSLGLITTRLFGQARFPRAFRRGQRPQLGREHSPPSATRHSRERA
jgi:hypothetical protein